LPIDDPAEFGIGHPHQPSGEALAESGAREGGLGGSLLFSYCVHGNNFAPAQTGSQALSLLVDELFCVSAKVAELQGSDGYCDDDVGTDERIRRKVQELLDHGIDQKTLAAKMGISDSTLSRWLDPKSPTKPLRLTALDGLSKYLRELRQAGGLLSAPRQKDVTDVVSMPYDEVSKTEQTLADSAAKEPDPRGAPDASVGTLPSREKLALPPPASDSLEDVIEFLSRIAERAMELAQQIRERNAGQQAAAPGDSQPPFRRRRGDARGPSAKKR
jgi:transcriptional regulator with XRE-family HTH domain